MKTLLRSLVVLIAFIAPHIGTFAADKLQVTVSFSILGDFASRVGGERVQVNTLVGPDEDAHAFAPKPADAKRILGSALLIRNGLGFEPWMKKLMTSASYRGPVLDASKGIAKRQMSGDHGVEVDPHAWQDPTMAIVYVRNIAEAFSQIDSAGATVYRSNAESFIQELTALDQWTRKEIESIPQPQRKVITSHDAFG
jgi:zinc/manganese transport system substrate-binding protein